MDRITYRNIIKTIKEYKGLPKGCLKCLERKFSDISKDTLYSILFIEYRYKMKNNHTKDEETVSQYWDMYKCAIERGEKPGVIVQMAKQFDVAPCLIARLILERYFQPCVFGKKLKKKIDSCLKQPSSLEDQHLSSELLLCNMADIMYSLSSESKRHALGQHYEAQLANELTKLGIDFMDEKLLRFYRYDKTPDIKLSTPAIIDGFVINWIESKALFGDKRSHKEYIKSQYQPYYTLFGSGLVIYWLGFLEDIAVPHDERFIVRSYMPTELKYPRSVEQFRSQASDEFEKIDLNSSNSEQVENEKGMEMTTVTEVGISPEPLPNTVDGKST